MNNKYKIIRFFINLLKKNVIYLTMHCSKMFFKEINWRLLLVLQVFRRTIAFIYKNSSHFTVLFDGVVDFRNGKFKYKFIKHIIHYT